MFITLQLRAGGWAQPAKGATAVSGSWVTFGAGRSITADNGGSILQTHSAAVSDANTRPSGSACCKCCWGDLSLMGEIINCYLNGNNTGKAWPRKGADVCFVSAASQEVRLAPASQRQGPLLAVCPQHSPDGATLNELMNKYQGCHHKHPDKSHCLFILWVKQGLMNTWEDPSDPSSLHPCLPVPVPCRVSSVL